MIEEWRPVVGFEGLYEVSNLGRLRGARRKGTDGRISRPCGYVRIRLYRDGVGYAVKVHRLVLEAFVGPCPSEMEGCHNNGKPDDNRVTNLRWDTRGHAKLTIAAVIEARNLNKAGASYNSLAKRYGVSSSTMRSAIVGKTWA